MTTKIPHWLLTFLIIITLIFFLQSKLLDPHLRYGFADVDWGFLAEYKRLGNKPVLKIYDVWKKLGVYTYQAYYIGIQENFFNISNFNFEPFQKTTHFFKFLSAITLFPWVYFFTKRILLASLATLLYTTTYAAVGPMYTVVVSGHFVAITALNLFLLYYWFIISKSKTGPFWLGFGLLLLILIIFLSPERMYPLLPIVLFIEIFYLWTKRFSKSLVKLSLLRLIVFLSPLLFGFAISKLFAGSDQFGSAASFFGNTKVIFDLIQRGNWHLILTPFVVFGSLFFPKDNLTLLNLHQSLSSGFGVFLKSILFNLFPLFLIFISVLSLLVAKYKIRYILRTLVFGFLFAVSLYILAIHRLIVDPSLRINFDEVNINSAIFGGLILSAAISSLINWVENEKKDIISLCLFIGPVIAFFFIFLTWLASDYTLIFTGVHRYLVVPAIGSSLFLSCLILLTFDGIKKIKILSNFASLALLLIIPIILMNFNVVAKYFDSELNFAGTDGAEHKRMKGELLSLLGNFDTSKPTLFYFDEADHQNGYFHETTIIAGFPGWLMFKGTNNLDRGIQPQYIRNAELCKQDRQDIPGCYKKLKDYLEERNGEKGILYKDIFYRPENFYAFRLQNRDIFDIKAEVLQAIDL